MALVSCVSQAGEASTSTVSSTPIQSGERQERPR